MPGEDYLVFALVDRGFGCFLVTGRSGWGALVGLLGWWKPFVMAILLRREWEWRPFSQCLTSLILNLAWGVARCNISMRKTVHTAEYRTFLRVLKEAREERGITQIELADRLSRAHDPISQSLFSKLERGEVRLDVVQLRWICAALGVSLLDFVKRLEAALAKSSRR